MSAGTRSRRTCTPQALSGDYRWSERLIGLTQNTPQRLLGANTSRVALSATVATAIGGDLWIAPSAFDGATVKGFRNPTTQDVLTLTWNTHGGLLHSEWHGLQISVPGVMTVWILEVLYQPRG